jgi:hypothetical protein
MVRRAALLGLALAAFVPASSQASITVGSDLSLPSGGNFDDCLPLSQPPCTHVLVGVHPGNSFPVKSPTKGTVTSFQIRTATGVRSGETVTFRLAQVGPYAPGSASGDGTGPTLNIMGGGIHSVPANLPVKVGDYIGIDTSGTTANSYPGSCNPPRGFFTFHPPLTDFAPLQPVDSNSTCELLVNAVIQPSTTVGFIKKNQTYKVGKKGKIILPIELPGPGDIKISGKGVARQSAASKSASVVKAVREAGTVKLPIKLSRKILGHLDAAGKASMKVKVVFTPVGGDPGTQSRKLKLRAG